MQNITIPAYAKINLTLRVLGRRPDGYHEISTIMQSIALKDTVSISKSDRGIQLEISGADLPSGPDNLAYRAAALLQHKYNFPGANISLVKKIPLAAGLAGGSADAAATLLGLNYLYNLGLNPGQLAREGAALGSDVPFCVLGGTALGQGRGEALTLLPAPARLWLVLVKPGFAVSTATVYKEWDVNPSWRTAAPPDEKAALAALHTGEWQQLLSTLGNELESITCRLYPEVAVIKARLREAGARAVVMCGSGPTVFGVAANETEAVQIAARLKNSYPEVLVSHTL